MWLLVLQASEIWHTPPWVISDQPGSLVWLGRLIAYKRELAAIQDNVDAQYVANNMS